MENLPCWVDKKKGDKWQHRSAVPSRVDVETWWRLPPPLCPPLLPLMVPPSPAPGGASPPPSRPGRRLPSLFFFSGGSLPLPRVAPPHSCLGWGRSGVCGGGGARVGGGCGAPECRSWCSRGVGGESPFGREDCWGVTKGRVVNRSVIGRGEGELSW